MRSSVLLAGIALAIVAAKQARITEIFIVAKGKPRIMPAN